MILINSQFQNKDILIDMSLVSAPIYNYPNALKHIIIIIIENAADILIERNIKNAKIIISLYKDENEYRLEIWDNAGGVKIDTIENIFEMYKSYKKIKGLGLGLALAKDLSNFLGTKIKVQNRDKGACFTLNIPI
jgi:signal transduction histidine kinase